MRNRRKPLPSLHLRHKAAAGVARAGVRAMHRGPSGEGWSREGDPATAGNAAWGPEGAPWLLPSPCLPSAEPS